MVLIIMYSVPCNVIIYMWSSLFLLLPLGCEFLKLIVSILSFYQACHSAFACSDWLTWRWIIMFWINFNLWCEFFKLVRNLLNTYHVLIYLSFLNVYPFSFPMLSLPSFANEASIVFEKVHGISLLTTIHWVE